MLVMGEVRPCHVSIEEEVFISTESEHIILISNNGTLWFIHHEISLINCVSGERLLYNNV